MNSSESRPENKNSYVAQHIAQLPKSGIRKFFDIVSTMKEVISLGVGEPDFVTPQHIREAGILSLERGHTSYTSNLGTPSLRKEICRYVSDNYQVSYDWSSQCLVTIGVSEALDLALRVILNPGDEVLYSEPCFVSYPAEISMSGGVAVPLPTSVANKFALTADSVRAHITPKTRAILLNFPCNPTGAVLPDAELEAIAQIAIDNDLIVIADEIYSELRYDGAHRSIAALPGMKSRTIFLHGFSKAFAMTGWRIGYACGPLEIIDAMMKVHQYAIMCAPTMAQEAAEEALKNGSSEVEKMRESYRQRRDIIVESLNEMGLACHKPDGAFYVFPDIRSTGLSSEDFAQKLLAEEKVAVVPGSAFGQSGEGFVRCCYATKIEDLRTALERMKNFCSRQKK